MAATWVVGVYLQVLGQDVVGSPAPATAPPTATPAPNHPQRWPVRSTLREPPAPSTMPLRRPTLSEPPDPAAVRPAGPASARADKGSRLKVAIESTAALVLLIAIMTWLAISTD